MKPTPRPFRTASTADVPAIVALVESAYRGESGRRGWTTESDLLTGQRTDADAVTELIDRSDSIVLLTDSGDRLVATAHIERRGTSGYFGMFAVAPDAQGGGIGKAVLAEAERIARQEWHCPTLRLSVIEQRADLIAWYERRGYRRTGEFEAFPYGDERYGVPQRDDLRFAVLAKDLAGG